MGDFGGGVLGVGDFGGEKLVGDWGEGGFVGE